MAQLPHQINRLLVHKPELQEKIKKAPIYKLKHNLKKELTWLIKNRKARSLLRIILLNRVLIGQPEICFFCDMITLDSSQRFAFLVSVNTEGKQMGDNLDRAYILIVRFQVQGLSLTNLGFSDVCRTPVLYLFQVQPLT